MFVVPIPSWLRLQPGGFLEPAATVQDAPCAPPICRASIRENQTLRPRGGLAMAKFMPLALRLAPGMSSCPHQHKKFEESFLVIRGSGVLYLDDNAMDIQSGDCIFVEPGETHVIKNSSNETLEIVIATGPAWEASDSMSSLEASTGHLTGRKPRKQVATPTNGQPVNLVWKQKSNIGVIFSRLL